MFHECLVTRYHCVDREQGPRCSRRLPSRVFKFGEVRQLALSQQMPHAVAVQVSLGRQLLVQRQTNIVCLPASLCVCLRHLTRRLHTIATFIASHSNQLFSTDSAELAGGIVLHIHKKRCKTSSVGQSAGLSIPRSSVRFRQKLQKPRTQIYMDLRCIDTQAKVLSYCCK